MLQRRSRDPVPCFEIRRQRFRDLLLQLFLVRHDTDFAPRSRKLNRGPERLPGNIVFNSSPFEFPLPTMPWKNYFDYEDDTSEPLWVQRLGIPGNDESCTLVGQHTMEGDPWVTSDPLECPPFQQFCGQEPPQNYLGAILIYRFRDVNKDGLTDLLLGLEHDANYFAPPNISPGSKMFTNCNINNATAGGSPSDDQTGNLPPSATTPAAALVLKPMQCGFEYPWNVIHHDGSLDGDLGDDWRMERLLAPIALHKQIGEPFDAPTSSGAIQSQMGSFSDLDGDGIPDFLRMYSPNGPNPPDWELSLHLWDGEAAPTETTEPWASELPNRPWPLFASSIVTGVVGNTTNVDGYATLIDLHGDGLPDLVERNSGNPKVYANYGFSTPTLWGFREESEHFWIDFTSLTDVLDLGGGAGFRRTVAQSFVDLDNDGRVDILTPTGRRFSTGGGFTPMNSVQGNEHQVTFVGADTWQVEQDFLDVDGDGIEERVTVDSSTGSTNIYFRDTTSRRAVLETIDNGHGATTTVSYAPSTDSSVVTLGSEKLPSSVWVVSSIARTQGNGAVPAGDSSFTYELPTWNADERGNFGYRGFKTVRSVGPSGASTEERYDYSQDWTSHSIVELSRGECQPDLDCRH